MESRIIISFFILLATSILSCANNDYSPKPNGYFRIPFPEKEYVQTTIGCPYEFSIPTYAKVTDFVNADKEEPCWKNIQFPQFNATLHISYFNFQNKITLEQLSEDARIFAFKHTSKATSIDQENIRIPNENKFGIAYQIGGNTASNYQFYLTDSTKHFIRGALYFNEKPNLDSIQPVLDFIKTDINQLIISLKWK
ncbi:gliding motility lipoprotein GldD [Sphingobacterium sp. HJSM2_6]|uniref:gliding motility lipoprotein GldD n=1 Tax=Sphingobacterium sp. HJSM2_6 TaxID=3366264 RepID=UPI003BDF3416